VDLTNEINVTGKVVLVTGANTGIGKATVLEMASRNAMVILACRDVTKGRKAVEWIRTKTSNGQLKVMKLDLASLDSVREFAKEFKSTYDTLHILVNNAGLALTKDKTDQTKDGFEIHFGVNHLGHFLLTNLLLDPLKEASPSRIVTVSSLAHSYGSLNFEDIMHEQSSPPKGIYGMSGHYSNSKLANALFNKELAKRMAGSGVTCYALCPGMVMTHIGTDQTSIILKLLTPLFWVLMRTPKEGASTVIHCALNKGLAKTSGQMYRDCKFWEPSDRIQLSNEDAEKLWSLSAKMVDL